MDSQTEPCMARFPDLPPTLHQRSLALTELRKLTHMEEKEDAGTQLQKAWRVRNNQQFLDLVSTLENNCNLSCEPKISRGLTNIATGKIALKETEDHLVHTFLKGQKIRVKFQEKCTDDQKRLNVRLPRWPINNFASEQCKGKPSRVIMQKKAAEDSRDAYISLVAL